MPNRSLVQRLRAAVPPYLFIIVALLLWEAAVRLLHIREYLLPAPSVILLATALKWRTLLSHGLITGQEIVLGFLLSVAVGIPLGMIIVFSKSAERAIFPVQVASQTVPKIAIAPILVLWLGFGVLPKMVISLLVGFFPVVVNTVIGLRATEEEMIWLAQSMGAGTMQTFLGFRLPRALPSIFGGLKVSMTMSVVGAIVGEFVGADKGLGYLLLVANGNMDSRLLFACVLVLTVMGILLYNVLDLLEKVLMPWERAKAERFSSATM